MTKMAVKIMIEGVNIVPTWTTIQELIQEASESPDGKLVKIDRVGYGSYASPGEYKLVFKPDSESAMRDVYLTVTDGGQ